MNAPMSFQSVMSKALKGLNWQCCLAFIDDIIVFSKSWSDHKIHLQEVFDRLRKANLKLHPAKCKFACTTVPYLGYTISESGLSVNSDKVKAVLEYPVPQTVTEVRSFLGLSNYYSRFIPDYSSLAAPLHALTAKKQKYMWDASCQTAFEKIKQALVDPPILSLPGPRSKPIIYTDASDVAIGFILGQVDKNGIESVIEYGGRALIGAEKNYSITHKEGLALVTAIEKYKPYIADKMFTVYTDHISLKWLQSLKDTTGRLGRWSLLLQPYTFEIVHKKGKSHGNADALSRRQYAYPQKGVSVEVFDSLPVLAPNVNLSDFRDTCDLESSSNGKDSRPLVYEFQYNPVFQSSETHINVV